MLIAGMSKSLLLILLLFSCKPLDSFFSVKPSGDVQKLLRSHHVLFKRMSFVSNEDRHGGEIIEDIQVLDFDRER